MTIDGKVRGHLRLLYLAQLRQRQAILTPIIARLHRGAVHLEDYQTLETEAHKLAGSGRVYGFDELTTAAAAIESCLRRGATTPEHVAELSTALLATIEAAFTESVSEEEIEETAEEAAPPAPIGYRPMILIAEDDPNMQTLLAELLQDVAIVRCVGTARKAMEAATAQRFDLVLLDQQLPDRQGVDVLATIRSAVSPDTIVIMITAVNSASEVKRLLTAGARDYIIKPFDPKVLVERIKVHLKTRTPSVLVADDDPLVREIVRNKLKQKGINVLIASNGEEALRIALQARPHVVILDTRMPRMDGIEVLIELRHDARTKALPVLVLSALTNERDISRAYKFGADDYIAKPFIPDEVVSRCMSFVRAAGYGLAA